jgi:hypothetical protein
MKSWIASILLGLFVTSTVNAETSSRLNIVLDTSGSMNGYKKDIADSILQIKQHSFERPTLIEKINLFSFTNQSEFILEGESDDIFSSIIAIKSEGSVEDGLIAIERILSDPQISDTHIILFTDEGRDVVKEIELDTLIELATEKNITIHSVLRTSDFCRSPQIIGTNSIFSGYSINREWLQCIDINSIDSLDTFIIRKKNKDYINLSLSTGGNIWSMDNIFGSNLKIDANNQKLDKRNAQKKRAIDSFSHFIANELSNSYDMNLRADVNITGEIAIGNIITIDVSNVVVKEGFSPVETWEWDINNDGAIDDYGALINFELREQEDKFITLWMISEIQEKIIREKQIIKFNVR